MRDVQEAFIWWLCLWLPDPVESDLRYLIETGIFGEIRDCFFERISSRWENTAPWVPFYLRHIDF